MNLLTRLFISFCGALACVFPAYLFFNARASTKKRREKALEKAISSKHVVEASRVKVAYLHPETSESKKQVWGHAAYRGYYEYEYNGRKYKYCLDVDWPPEKLTLYFLKNPRKARIKEHLVDSSTNWPGVFFIVAAIFFRITFWY